jgi:hypothetical protein
MSLAIGRAADAEKYNVCINKSDLQAVQWDWHALRI